MQGGPSGSSSPQQLHALQAIPPPQPDRRPFFSGQAQVLDEEAQKRSAAAAQQLGSAIGDPASIGAKLMSKMGFGVAGQGLGRTGQVSPLQIIMTCKTYVGGLVHDGDIQNPETDLVSQWRRQKQKRQAALPPDLQQLSSCLGDARSLLSLMLRVPCFAGHCGACGSNQDGPGPRPGLCSGQAAQQVA